MKLQNQVKEFHEKFGLKVNDNPVIPDNDLIKLRINLIREEVAEFENELNTNSIDLCAVAKELADILYVVVGTAVSFGIDLEPVLDEVHRSNMSKVWEDGTIKRREDGKILKPPTYSPAKIKLS
ncbi:MAG: MazG nucleotide pyrophosphohydrolase domain-containing protein [Stygiobacter sp.]